MCPFWSPEREVFFLIDASGDCGKGANTVISLLHYYFEHHGLDTYVKKWVEITNCVLCAILQFMQFNTMVGSIMHIQYSFKTCNCHSRFSTVIKTVIKTQHVLCLMHKTAQNCSKFGGRQRTPDLSLIFVNQCHISGLGITLPLRS